MSEGQKSTLREAGLNEEDIEMLEGLSEIDKHNTFDHMQARWSEVG